LADPPEGLDKKRGEKNGRNGTKGKKIDLGTLTGRVHRGARKCRLKN